MATLLALYSAVWTQGKYPKPLMEAIVIPLLNVGKDPLKAENYLPSIVNLLSRKVIGEDDKQPAHLVSTKTRPSDCTPVWVSETPFY